MSGYRYHVLVKHDDEKPTRLNDGRSNLIEVIECPSSERAEEVALAYYQERGYRPVSAEAINEGWLPTIRPRKPVIYEEVES